MADKIVMTLTNYVYNTECNYCGYKKEDCMLIVNYQPMDKFICEDCRKISREHDGWKFVIGHEDVKTPGGKIIPPPEKYTDFDEKTPKKPPINKSGSGEEPYVEPD